MIKRPNISKSAARLFSTALILILMFPGCADKSAGFRRRPAETSPPKTAETIQKEVVARISRRVLGNIPNTGRLKEIRNRGVLRVALPPPEPPFQTLDPIFKAPGGFNPALINEIALILDVKPNMTIQQPRPAGKTPLTEGWEKNFDLLLLSTEKNSCRSERTIKYFFSGGKNGWKILCAAGAGTDDSLASAVNEILSYLNETGIYARLYNEYVGPK